MKLITVGVLLLAAAAVPMAQSVAGSKIPAGTSLEVLLQTALSSKDAKVDQRFEATTLQSLEQKGQMVIAAGSTVRGFVGSVRPTRAGSQAQLTLAFDEVRAVEQSYRLRATITAVLDPKPGKLSARAEAGPVTGAPVGLPAFAGVFVGPGGAIAARDGSDVKLPVGVVLRLRLDEGLR